MRCKQSDLCNVTYEPTKLTNTQTLLSPDEENYCFKEFTEVESIFLFQSLNNEF